MAKRFDLMVANGNYTDNNGQEKTRWLKIGSIMDKQSGGMAMKLDCVPVSAEWDGWVQLFEPQDNQNRQQGAPQGGYNAPNTGNPAPTPAQGGGFPATGFPTQGAPQGQAAPPAAPQGNPNPQGGWPNS